MANKTIHSHTDTYCPVGEFLKRVDVRVIQQLASDDNNPIVAGLLGGNDNVLAALRSASGFLEAAALMGERYRKEDLVALLASDTNARAMLYDIVAGFARTRMRERRPELGVQETVQEQRSAAWLEQLADGKRIFGFEETMDAGHLDSEQMTNTQIEERNLSSVIAEPLFGTRRNRWRGW